MYFQLSGIAKTFSPLVLTNLTLNKSELNLIKDLRIRNYGIFKLLYVFLFTENIILSDKRSFYYHLFYYFSPVRRIICLPDGFSDMVDGNSIIPVVSPVTTPLKRIVYKMMAVIGSFYKINKKVELLNLSKLDLTQVCQTSPTQQKAPCSTIFIGQPLSEYGILTVEDEIEILKFLQKDFGLIKYYLHPKESPGKFAGSNLTISIINYSLPCEIMILKNESPANIIGCYSTAFYNLKPYFNSKVNFYSVNILAHVNKRSEYWNGISKTYKFIKKSNIKIIKF